MHACFRGEKLEALWFIVPPARCFARDRCVGEDPSMARLSAEEIRLDVEV